MRCKDDDNVGKSRSFLLGWRSVVGLLTGGRDDFIPGHGGTDYTSLPRIWRRYAVSTGSPLYGRRARQSRHGRRPKLSAFISEIAEVTLRRTREMTTATSQRETKTVRARELDSSMRNGRMTRRSFSGRLTTSAYRQSLIRGIGRRYRQIGNAQAVGQSQRV